MLSVAQEKDAAANRRLLEALTTRLPQWFAQAESNRHYAEQAEKLEAWTAPSGRASGGPAAVEEA